MVCFSSSPSIQSRSGFFWRHCDIRASAIAWPSSRVFACESGTVVLVSLSHSVTTVVPCAPACPAHLVLSSPAATASAVAPSSSVVRLMIATPSEARQRRLRRGGVRSARCDVGRRDLDRAPVPGVADRVHPPRRLHPHRPGAPPLLPVQRLATTPLHAQP